MIDVGANFGYEHLLFGLLSGNRTESITFEPDPANFAWLSRNLGLNPELKVTAVQAAVSDTDGGVVPFATAKLGHSGLARVGSAWLAEYAGETIKVPTITLDSYLDQRGIASVPITLIDVEGHESRVIDGMAKGIAAAGMRALSSSSIPGHSRTRLARPDRLRSVSWYGGTSATVFDVT